MMTTRILHGDLIPHQLQELTLKEDGVMADWLKKDRKTLVAVIQYDNTFPVAWFGFKKGDVFLSWFGRNDFQVSVFVDKEYRGKKIATHLVSQGLDLIRQINPDARILYGAADEHSYFNDIYKRLISNAKLTGKRYFAI